MKYNIELRGPKGYMRVVKDRQSHDSWGDLLDIGTALKARYKANAMSVTMALPANIERSNHEQWIE